MPPIPIKRISHTTDETAPWDGVVFTYDVGSDELNEALRICFPDYRTLGQRKHAAIIKFLEQELSQMPLSKAHQSSARIASTQDFSRTDSVYGDVLAKAQQPVQSQEISSTTHSPATSNGSLVPQEKSERYPALSASATQPLYIDPTAATHSSQFVFNAFDGRTMQPKTKRRMTVEERMEYKETRKRGACSKCKLKKGKCTHMSGVGDNANGHSVMTEQLKRGISHGPNTPDTKFGKRFQPTLEQDRHDSVASQQYDPQQPQSTDTSRRSSIASRQIPSVSVSPQWANTVTEEPQSGMSGYVQPSHLSEQVAGFTTNGQASCLTDYRMDNPNSFHDFTPFQSGPAFQYGQDTSSYPGYPTIRVHEPDQDGYIPTDGESLGFSSFNQWDLDSPSPG